jgi:hypothetical protein
VLVKADRPLAAGPLELLKWIEERMPMFAPVKRPARRKPIR